MRLTDDYESRLDTVTETARARWTFSWVMDGEEAHLIYTGTRDIEGEHHVPVGIWYSPFPNEPGNSYAFGLLESAGQADDYPETPAVVLKYAMMVFGEPWKIAVQ